MRTREVDLTGDKFEELIIGFTEATLVFDVFEPIASTWEFDVWGADVVDTKTGGCVCPLNLPMYVQGRASIKFEDVTFVALTAHLYDRSGSGWKRDQAGNRVIFSRDWQVAEAKAGAEYVFETVLYKPASYVHLSIFAAGRVTFRWDCDSCIHLKHHGKALAATMRQQMDEFYRK